MCVDVCGWVGLGGGQGQGEWVLVCGARGVWGGLCGWVCRETAYEQVRPLLLLLLLPPLLCVWWWRGGGD